MLVNKNTFWRKMRLGTNTLDEKMIMMRVQLC
jgi:hypothetical protein